MSNIDDEVRELLRRKAQDVPPHQEVPRSLVRRTHRRIVLNAVAVGATAVVLAAGVFAGVRAISGPSTSVPIAPGPSPSPSIGPSPTTAVPAACTSGQLGAAATMQGAAGSREGAISLTNMSNTTCTLEGTPAITLLDQNQVPITSGIGFIASPPTWQVDRGPRPAGWPVVTLQPGDSASVRVRWGNWCPDGRAAPVWRIEVPGGGTIDVSGLDGKVSGPEGDLGPPPCNGQGQPSTIEVGPFEPAPHL